MPVRYRFSTPTVFCCSFRLLRARCPIYRLDCIPAYVVCVSVLLAARLDELRDQLAAALDRALLRAVIDVHDAEAPLIPERPLEVIEQRPHEVPANIDALLDGLIDGGQMPLQKRNALRIV